MKFWLRSLLFLPVLSLVAVSAAAQSAPLDSAKANAEKASAPPADAPAPDAAPATTPEPPLRRLDGPELSPADEIRARAEAIRQRADEMRQRARERTETERIRREQTRHRTGRDVVNVFSNSHLAADERVDNVVAVFGSAHSEGEAVESVVSVFGQTRSLGPVGENVVTVFGDSEVSGRVGEEVVTVFGNTTLNSRADRVVSVFGDVKLGPKAEVGELVCVMGRVERDPAAVVHGGVNNVGRTFGLGSGIGVWVSQCLFKLRPLAFQTGVLWAWVVALSFLALYLFVALLFRGGVERCILTLETRPGAALLAAVGMPIFSVVAIALLCITFVGIVVVPFLAGALFFAGLFGNAVILAWLGQRLLKASGNAGVHPAVAVLVGGALILALYTVPVLGLITYKVLGWVGVGVVVATLLIAKEAKKSAAGVAFTTGADPVGSAGPVGATAFGMTSPALGATLSGVVSSGAVAGEGVAVPPPPVVSAVMLPRAGFWIRLGALFLDLLILWLGVLILTQHLGLMPICLSAYAAIMWKLKATTVGGVVCGLKVVRLDGREIDWTTAIVRTLGCFLSLITAGLGFIWVAVDEGKQSWHDKIAGTTVVRVPKGISLI